MRRCRRSRSHSTTKDDFANLRWSRWCRCALAATCTTTTFCRCRHCSGAVSTSVACSGIASWCNGWQVESINRVETSSQWSGILPMLRRGQNQGQLRHRRGCHAAAGTCTSSYIAAALVVIVSSTKHTFKLTNDGIIPVSSTTATTRSEDAVMAVKVEGTEGTHANRRKAARRVVAFVPRRRECR